MSKNWKALSKGLLGLLLLGGVIYLANPMQLYERLQQATLWWLVVGFFAAIASNVVSAWRWRAIALGMGAQMSIASSMRWYFQAIGLNVLLPGAVVGGDVYRAVALQRTGQPKAASNLSVIFDRASGLWMLCAMGGLGAAACASTLAPWVHLPVTLFACLLLVGTALWLAFPWMLMQALRKCWIKLPFSWLEPLREASEIPDFSYQLWLQAVSSALVQLLSAAALASGAAALGLILAPQAWAFAIAPIFLMAALPLSVGGWGSREAATVVALTPFGVPASIAVGVGLLYGIFALGQGVFGAIALGLPSKNIK